MFISSGTRTGIIGADSHSGNTAAWGSSRPVADKLAGAAALHPNPRWD
jgi:hypothetical protein